MKATVSRQAIADANWTMIVTVYAIDQFGQHATGVIDICAFCEGQRLHILQEWEATNSSIVFDAPRADFFVAGGSTQSEINRTLGTMDVNARIVSKICREKVVDEGRFMAQDWRVDSVEIGNHDDGDVVCVTLDSVLGFVVVFAPILWNEAAGWHIGIYSENLWARSNSFHVVDAERVVIPLKDMFRHGKLALMVKNAWLPLKARIDANELPPSVAAC